jgi:hypothetical protein
MKMAVPTDWLDLATKAIVIVGAIATFLWVLLKPAWFALYKWTSRRAFRVDDGNGRSVAMVDFIPRLSHAVREIQTDINDMKEGGLIQGRLLDTLPDIRRNSDRATEAATRIEDALGKLSDQVLTLTEKVGELQGKLSK